MMLTQVHRQPCPIYQDPQGTFWVSKRDLALALHYKSPATLDHILKTHSQEIQGKRLSGYCSLYTTLVICKHSAHKAQATAISNDISAFVQAQIPPEPKLEIVGYFTTKR
ncbi:hypothetical protein CEB3_c19780 [Peptococcaceae bacterium CEB3]|nr:hypothetical protein CEB3_c19780 [Peptococcaceae bacterium CEB3]